MSLHAADRIAFERTGYLHLPGLLDPDVDLIPLREEYALAIDRAAADMRTRGIVNSEYRDLPFDERIGRLYEASDGALHTYLDIALPQRGVTCGSPAITSSDGLTFTCGECHTRFIAEVLD